MVEVEDHKGVVALRRDQLSEEKVTHLLPPFKLFHETGSMGH
jgi:hypothetical protein